MYPPVKWRALIGLLFLLGHTAQAAPPAVFGESATPRIFKLWDFQTGSFSENYDMLVHAIRPGDSIELKPGKFVMIEKKLGMGTTTRIFSIGNRKAIRLAKESGMMATQASWCPAFLSYYYDGAARLLDTGIAMGKVFLSESDRDHYIIVGEEDILFTLGDILAGEVSNQKAMEELGEFARTTWRVRKVGDMHVNQLAYTAEGWKLLDFNHVVTFATSPGDATIFSYMKGLPIRMKNSLSKVVETERGERSEWDAGRLRTIIDQLRRAAVSIRRF
jgi:hypothetical protein